METHAERFRHMMQEWGLTQEELGNLCGIKRGTVGTIVNSKTVPDVEALARLKQAKPELSWDWLLLGKGPMLTSEPAYQAHLRESASLISKMSHKAATPAPLPVEADTAAEVGLVASRGGLPTPGAATPQQADFVGRLIKRLEDELDASKAREGYWQDRAERLEKPSPTPDATWLYLPPASEISMRPTACITAPDAKAQGGKVLAMYPSSVATRAQA